MARRTSVKPTAAELEILGVLWLRGPSTVHDVQGALARGATVTYTTVLKLLQIMVEKGLVKRHDVRRPHVFRAAVPEGAVKRRIVTELVDRVFDGSAMRLVMHALSVKPATPEELRELRSLLDDLEGEQA